MFSLIHPASMMTNHTLHITSRHSLSMSFFLWTFSFQIGNCAFHPSSWVKACNHYYSILLKIGLSPTNYIFYWWLQRKVISSLGLSFYEDWPT
ncbi:hypothetical protein DM01DRAFT_1128955 [Hesseltinella vesiculosa]|uniref:Uncharacterized protein n=1 Tax=Hesseltinella vesiculosa TaxID=101127 RepID=A0A1X2GW07_9FUNG|nr:hypothetical protein DM01DRAFT_1128955 [Hesseltinella vesiculosa]